MTDSKLRELERRWKETQSVEDEAAYLLERVRVGDLEREKLELAAYCGHEGAREALGDEAPRMPEELEEWTRALEAWGDEVTVRAAVEAARYASAFYMQLEPDDSRCTVALDAAQTWCRSPSDEAEMRAASAYAEAAQAANDFRAKHCRGALLRTSGGFYEHRLALYGVWAAAYAAAAAAGGANPHQTRAAAVVCAVHRAAALPGVEQGLPAGDSEAVLRAMRAELMQLALTPCHERPLDV